MMHCKIINCSKLPKSNLIRNLIKRYGSHSQSSNSVFDEVLKDQKESLTAGHYFSWNRTHHENEVEETKANHNQHHALHDQSVPSNMLCKRAFLRVVTSEKNTMPTISLDSEIVSPNAMKIYAKRTFYFNASAHVHRAAPFYLTPGLKDADYIFFTSMSWDSISVCLTYLDKNNPKLEHPVNVYGPPGFRKYWNTLTKFLYSTVVIRTIIKPKFFIYEMCESEKVKSFVDKLTGSKISLINVKPVNREDLGKCKYSAKNNSLCYIVELPGNISVNDIDSTTDESSLNTEKGGTTETRDEMLISQFSSVKEFKLNQAHPTKTKDENEEDSNLIDLKQNSPRPMSVVVLECPSIDYIPFLDNAFGSSFSSSTTYTIVHLTKSCVLNTNAYQKWMAKFHKSCNHVFVNEDTNKVSDMYLRHKVNRNFCNLINSQFFPIYSSGHSILPFRELKNQSLSPLSSSHYCLTNNTLLPVTYPQNKIEKVERVIQDRLNVLNTYEEIYGEVQDVKVSSSIDDNGYPRIVVLGGGGNCNGIRANPCFLVMIDKQRSVMLDCGATSFSQLYEHFGPHFTPKVLSTIKAIILTHRHSDHFSGVCTMLEELKKQNPQADTVIALPNHTTYKLLMYYLDKYEPNLKGSFQFLQISRFTEYETIQCIKNHVKLDSLYLPIVSHGVFTVGVIMKFDEYKLVYSSDTLPMSKGLIQKGRNADVLIHDCLFVSDDSEIEACFKKHSTLKGAIITANAMNARNLLTTHFSESYPFVPMETLDHPTIKLKGTHMFAIDHLELPLKDSKFRELSQHHDKLKTLFPVANHHRAEKRRDIRTLNKKEKYLKSFKQKKM